MNYNEFRNILDDIGHTPCMSAPDLFFSIDGDTNNKHYKLSKPMCDMCDIKEKCLEYALTNNERDGIWGGTTPQERRAIFQAQDRQSRTRATR